MSTLRYCFLLWIVLLSPVIAHAQHEYDVWHFGYGVGMDFRSGSPVLLQGTPVYTGEGSAVMCDRQTGEFLFSADGDNVYNRNGRVLPNGNGILAGGGTSLQGDLIIPMPCNPEKYYLFTADYEGYTPSSNNRGIHYSIIDMTLDGGLGGVTSKNVPLLSKASERQTAIMHANGHDYWVLVHSLGGRTFYAFKVSATGIDRTPVISIAGMDQGNPPNYPNTTIGCLEVSPTGRKIALTGYLDVWTTDPPIGSLVELYDFDPATGQVSNPVPLVGGGLPDADSVPGFKSFGVSFSPDGSRLYAGGPPLFQWSLDVDDPDAIRASRIVVNDSTISHGVRWTYRAMQIGPDGRIYINQSNSYVSVIANPNAKGKACGLIDTAYQFPPLQYFASLGLPNNIDDRAFFKRPPATPRQVRIDSVRQLTRCSPAVVTASAGFVRYEWSDGQTGRRASFDKSDRYIVTAIDSNGCTSMEEVIVLVRATLPLDITADGPLSFCQGGTVTLAARQGFPSYSWSTGARTRLITVDRSGTYIVSVTTQEECVLHDTIVVQVTPVAIVHARAGTLWGSPGDTITVPVMLEQPLDNAVIQSLKLSLRYDPTMMMPLLPRLSGASATAELERSRQGTLLGEWNLQMLKDSAGELTLQLTPPASMNSIQGTGELLRIRFATFVLLEKMGQSTLTAELPLSIDIGERRCLELGTSSGRIDLSFCGSSFRQMVLGLENYGFDGVVPNPFAKATEFRFWLGLDGDTKLEVFDQSGRYIATVLNRHMPSGYHAIEWDATGIPSGPYQYRLTSGTWTVSGQIVILQ